jgi:hypothetical protein
MKKWYNKNYPKRVYTGSYVRTNGKRLFKLTTSVKILFKTKKYHHTFKSWQEAIKKGWIKK